MRIPRLFPQFATKTTLAEEFFDGIPLDDFINDRAHMPDEERLRVANCFLRDLMRQYSVDGFFHADPHPGNLFVFEDGRIGYIDFGIMGRAVTGPIHMLKFFKGTVEPDIRYATEGLVRFAQTRIEEEARELFLQEPKYRQASDIVINFIIEKLSEDLEPTNREWHKQTGNPKLPLFERSSATAFFKMIKSAEQYGISFPPDVIGFIRALLIIDMVC